MRFAYLHGDAWAAVWHADSALAFTEAPEPEGVPEDRPRVCSHGIYHHGCPSCDRQDPASHEPAVQPMTDHVYELPTDRCACGHTRMVHEPHCVVTYYAPKRACPDNCREFVHDPEATDD